MMEPTEYRFDGICDFLDDVQAEYEQTEEFQAMQQCADENYARICELAAGIPELLKLIRKREDLVLNLYASRETQNIRALIKELRH